MWEVDSPVGPPRLINSTLTPEALIADSRYDVKMLGWNTPPEYLEYVDPFWKTFEAPNPAYHYMLGTLFIFLTTISLIGNSVVMYIFATSKSLQTPSNMLVINLAFMDFIMMSKTPVFIVNSFNEGPIWGKFGCSMYGLLAGFSGPGASMTNAMIAYDRYKTIAKPFDSKMTRSTAMAIVLFIWMYALPWSLLPYFEIFNRFVPEAFMTSCTFDYLSDTDESRAFVALIFFFAFCIPAMLIIFFYSQIYSHVRAHEKAMREQAKRMNVTSLRGVGSKEEQEKSAECRIAKVAIFIFFLFVVSWLPYAIIALNGAFGNRQLLTPIVAMIPACTCKTVATFDPWVYAFNHPKYRLELQKKMPWFCIHEEQPKDNSTQGSEKA